MRNKKQLICNDDCEKQFCLLYYDKTRSFSVFSILLHGKRGKVMIDFTANDYLISSF